jgi:hypothetical protein
MPPLQTSDIPGSGIPAPHPNLELINRFYQAFQRLEAPAMAVCYDPEVQFSDPVFGTLHGGEAADMWRMLTQRAQDFSLSYEAVSADALQGRARWTAGRTVVNRIEARFEFRDGLILRHHDSFSVWRWARQALGLPGLLLGWTPFMRAAIRRKARRGLAAYQAAAAKTADSAGNQAKV